MINSSNCRDNFHHVVVNSTQVSVALDHLRYEMIQYVTIVGWSDVCGYLKFHGFGMKIRKERGELFLQSFRNERALAELSPWTT